MPEVVSMTQTCYRTTNHLEYFDWKIGQDCPTSAVRKSHLQTFKETHGDRTTSSTRPGIRTLKWISKQGKAHMQRLRSYTLPHQRFKPPLVCYPGYPELRHYRPIWTFVGSELPGKTAYQLLTFWINYLYTVTARLNLYQTTLDNLTKDAVYCSGTFWIKPLQPFGKIKQFIALEWWQ